MATELHSAFERTIDEGVVRLGRSWPGLLATGTVGGIDVGMGILALLLVRHLTHSEAASSLAFGIGFVALTLANSELFTENFLVPIVAVTARKSGPLAVLRLWGGTLATNLLGGWIIMAVVVGGLPEVRPIAVQLGRHFADAGVNLASFATAVLGGAIITLMTWMERGTESVLGKLVAAVAAAFLLAAGALNHAIVLSLEMFAGLQAGAPYGYGAWAVAAAWATFGNIVGGVGLVTVLRLVQVGAEKIQEERERPEGLSRADDEDMVPAAAAIAGPAGPNVHEQSPTLASDGRAGGG